jgi:D-lyxose ketol-isomerase
MRRRTATANKWKEERRMKRSSINKYIAEATAFFADHHFFLPPYAIWTPEDWAQRGSEADEIRKCRLGWDVTDFNSGEFDSVGLTLFTLRNGSLSGHPASKAYAEKIMFVRQNQVTPFHYHVRKTEDIINRGSNDAGRLAVQLYGSTENGEFADRGISVSCDGIKREVDPGQTIILGPGESITLTPYLYHTFHAIDGHALIGEVSSQNDDDTDNYFKEPLPRYPQIDEDEAPLRVLCTEYAKTSDRRKRDKEQKKWQ